MKLFGKCLRENLKSPLTYAGIILFVVLCGFGTTVEINEENYSFFGIIFDPTLLSRAKKLIECSSFLISYRFSQSNWYAIGFAVITAVPPLFTYIRSFEKIHHFSLIRSNYRSYSAGIVFSSFLSGMIIMLAGILMYTAAAYLTLPSFSSFADEMYQMIYGETVSARLFLFMKQAFDHVFIGGIISVFAINIYRFIRSDFLAATIPMMIMYISVKVIPNYGEWLGSDIRHYENVFARAVVLIFPSTFTELGSSLEKMFQAPFWIAYIIFGAFLFAMYILFYRSVKRFCL